MKLVDQLRYFAALKGWGALADGRIDHWLGRMNLSGGKTRTTDLSKGCSRRSGLSRRCCDPDLLILDRPFSGLDR
jgi:ABC-type uncharacterized transport system ATPase subunit